MKNLSCNFFQNSRSHVFLYAGVRRVLKRTLWVLIVTAIYSTSASVDAHAGAKVKETTMSNSDKIISAVQKMSFAMERGNLEEVLASYEKGASLVVQPGVTASGPELRQAFMGFISMKPKFSFSKHEVIESGDIALHISPWTMEAIDPSSGHPIKQSGLSLAVFRRQNDGSWLMVIDNPHGEGPLSN